MRRILPLLLLLFGATAAAALEIDILNRYDRDAPIVLTAQIDEAPPGSDRLWDWDLEKPARGIEVKGGTTLHVWAGPGTYLVELEVLTVDWDNRKITKEEVEAEFTVGEPNPPPPPPPPRPKDSNRPRAGARRACGATQQSRRLLCNSGSQRAGRKLGHYPDQRPPQIDARIPHDRHHAAGCSESMAAILATCHPGAC